MSNDDMSNDDIFFNQTEIDFFDNYNDLLNSRIERLTHIFNHSKILKFINCEICFSNFASNVFCKICNKDNYNLAINFHNAHNNNILNDDVFIFVNDNKINENNNENIVSGKIFIQLNNIK